MPGNAYTSVRSRTVANALRLYREERKLSCEDVGEVLGVSASKISRMETGKSGLQFEDVNALLGYYRVSPARRKELLDLVRRGEDMGWWERQAGLPRLWRTLIDLEDKATRIQSYETMMVPGLLQTAEYCQALLRAVDPDLSDRDVDALVSARMARQTILTRSSAPQFLAVLHESALRIRVGGEGPMRRQLRQLVDLGERPNITVLVVPTSAGPHVGVRGSFTLLDFRHEPTTAFVENQHTGRFFDDAADLDGFRGALRTIVEVALPPEGSANLISALTRE
ncbi:helix-turn-helix transcriptional regulator [Actinosynnema sp. NPDC020468]|uniref:helix-turn-helix domain-containing protein n=1 Tax=Actinosynnema sp. NPDC020468 TaxID=3154488 RepID=UPI0033E14870